MTRLLIALFSISLLFTGSELYAAEKYEFKTNEKVIVVGDVHGALEQITQALTNLKVIDKNGHWSAGKKHLVSLGDLIDRGPHSRKVMDLFIRLQKEAQKAGGKVHVVLGNHEVMNIKGDLRYLSEADYAAFEKEETKLLREEKFQDFLRAYRARETDSVRAQFDEAFPKGFFALTDAFTEGGYYGKWLLKQPFVIKVNQQLFAHGGLSNRVEKLSLTELNEQLKETLRRYLKSWDRLSKKNDSMFYPAYKQRYGIVDKLSNNRSSKQFMRTQNSLLFSSYGPTWYRGNALCHPYYETDNLTKILNELEAKRLWVGHTTTRDTKPHNRLDDQLVILDTGMLTDYYGGKPHVGVINKNGDYKVYDGLTAEEVEVTLSPKRENINPFGLTDEKMIKVMKLSKVVNVSKGESDEGDLVTLSYDGHNYQARFFALDEAPNANKGEWNAENNDAIRYQYEFAAYQLDRMLNIGLVPVTIEQEIEGVAGALQILPMNIISESELLSDHGGQIGVCSREQQVNLKDSFDYLIQNSVGRRGNTFYSKEDGQLVFLGHTKSFSPSSRFTSKSRPEEVYVTAAFKKALLNIQLEDLMKLKPWLHQSQIEGIWARRERLLD